MGKALIAASDNRLPEVIERLKARSSTLLAESKAFGFTHNGPLRGALRELLGRDGFARIMAGRKEGRPQKKSANKKEFPVAAAPSTGTE